MRWITATHTMRYRAHYHTSGEGALFTRDDLKASQFGTTGIPVCRYTARGGRRHLTRSVSEAVNYLLAYAWVSMERLVIGRGQYMSSETLFVPDWSSSRKTGGGVHFGDGCNRLGPESRPGVVVAVANSSLPELGRSGQRAPDRKELAAIRKSAQKEVRMDRSNGCNRPPHDWVWPHPPKSRSPASPFSGIPRRKHHQ